MDKREFARTNRVLARADVRDGDEGVDGLAHAPAVIELVRLLPEALAAHSVRVGKRFAVAAAHFEGWGAPSSRLNGEMPVD